MPPKRKFKGTKVISNSPLKAPRNSLDENAQNEDATPDHEDARPAKRSRTSSDSGSPQRSNGSFDNNTPMNGTQTPELQKPASSATSTAPKTAAKRRRASDDSSQSSKTRPNGVLTRTQSDVSEQQPRKKRKTKESQTDTAADQPPELTDASTAPNSPEQVPDVDGSQSLQNVLPTNGDAPAKSGRRLPGRRRQPHPDINVETDLRRQLNLKMSYRSLAKVQKALLEELANRTTKNLEDDPQYHKKCPEYEAVMAQLDQRRDSRLDQINSLRTYRLEELERIRVAEEHIQREQYVNRFRELQDDFMLQIFFRAKQLEREMKSQHADATDDEDNILPPTFSDEVHHAEDYRIGSKFASRSRAYVEADKELENDSVRRKFTAARVAFVENDEEADDSIEDVAGGFAKFDGPDRTEAIAHYNIASLADAAIEVERTPTPQPEPKAIEVIPNEHAALLMMLADISAHQPRTTAAPKPQYHYPDPRQQPPPPPRATTPVIKQEFVREKSPEFAQPAMPLGLPSQAAHSSPPKVTQVAVDLTQNVSRSEPNAAPSTKETEAPAKTTPRLSTHRIMDILNDDQEVPVSRTRESQSSTQQPSTPSMRESSIHPQTPSRSDALRVDAVMNKEEPPIDQALMDALSGPPQSNPPSSPPSNTQSWQHPSVPPQTRESDESLRRRDPLQKIRELLDRKARELAPPINFRFAHYDPAPPRQPYPPQSPSYPPTSHPPQGPPPPSYQPAYGSAPSYQGGYIPPPGSFQAPPPPPSSMAPYQPLKIHQYGGQPILPANMAPLPHSGPPPLPFIGQSGPPQQQGPPPPQHQQQQQQQQQQQAYSPTHPHPPPMQYEQREAHSQSNGDRSSESQSRPRRQYRSYHAPGTQFRSYQGPGEQRRRGG
ncbi:uncharacterized protein J4E92_006056 [Alternaria infectoria]|uniref:uncharacterized protein n=1 Tax=Alternaria infectoria TaxID=45303 RepID=UPI0022208F06|nr:uncharacterized protein J4E92_006056 [Alternaria infectoria]KAI4926896.1 hypothetical protein J4E92_006056 [Alternaria infectoria]